MGAACTMGLPEPEWDAAIPLASGSDKEVFLGKFRGKPCAIAVAKRQGEARLKKEIAVLKLLGKHPFIVPMLYSDVTRGDCMYFALEAVQPVGYDLDRLVKQHQFARQSVPSALMRALIAQLGSAVDHMHNLKIVHRDIKSENVLVTRMHEAKLIDMGIAIRLGDTEPRWVRVSKSYFAPEMCQGGNTPQGPEIDYWGLGLILHQVYQHRWDIVDASRQTVVLRKDRPCTVEPMDPNLLTAMTELLSFDPASRWSTKKLQETIPPDAADVPRAYSTRSFSMMRRQSVTSSNSLQPVNSRPEDRKLLCKWKASLPPLTAYAVVVDKNSKHLHGRRLEQTGFRQNHNAVLLFVDRPEDRQTGRKGSVEKMPSKDTVITNGCWLYFGMPPTDAFEDTITSLKKEFFPAMSSESVGHSVNARDGLIAFSLEFDCFAFPEHTPKGAIIGRSSRSNATQLNIRNNFGLNLAGIVRPGKPDQPEWFPGPTATVEPGDLALVVRWPCQDGTSEPTVTDEQLTRLMSPVAFAAAMSEHDAKDVPGSPVVCI